MSFSYEMHERGEINVVVFQDVVVYFFDIFVIRMSMQTLISVLTYLFPVISAFTCCLLMIFTYKDSVRREERYLKRVLCFLYLSAAFGWLCVIIYAWSPSFFVYLNALCYFSFIVFSVIFYHVVFCLTRIDRSERFPMLHYLLPVLIPAVLLVWSFFIPFDVQVAIVAEDSSLEDSYFCFARFFTSKLPFSFLFCLCYTLLGLFRLSRYQKRLNDEKPFVLRWLGVVLFLFLVSLCMPLLAPLFAESYWLDFIPVLILLAQYTILSYHIIAGNYSLYLMEDVSSEFVTGVSRKSSILDRGKFEKYIQEEKPYLNPDLKITDLAKCLHTNRTYLSTFINRTYGMNFNCYINTCRLQELSGLLRNPLNVGSNISDLVIGVGFGCYHSYRRAKKRCGDRK